MVLIKPFRGWFYDEKKVGRIADVVSPPHDVISKEERAALKRRSKHNIVRVLLPPNGDYKGAASVLKKLIADKVIIKDKKPAYYAYEQEFSIRGKKLKRLGLLALVKADPLGNDVLPHERTFPDQIRDRFELLNAAHAELCPVFGLYSGDGSLAKVLGKAKKALFEFTDDRGVINRIWPVYDTETITRHFTDKKIIIADGHHRYTAASQLAAEGHGSGYTLMYLSDISDPALKILPTHRIVESPGFDMQRFLQSASDFFEASKARDIDSLEGEILERGKHHFGVHDRNDSYLLRLKDPSVIDSLGTESRDWKNLDVSILQRLILDRLLRQSRISYAKHQEDVVRLISDGSHHVAFLLPNTGITEVVRIVEHGEVMPHKSTYFYPKPLAGVVIHIIE